eukprot:TRINITY_DN5353_c0_g1_i1.p1 TRINITY_DN5353_c0_g1~~TRINITY_DN5353_c0_g1_i1.p1  ORF type:complete len:134 (-),score=17.88 TRINITY_DN5353_c0_g1_i1:307-708(-)
MATRALFNPLLRRFFVASKNFAQPSRFLHLQGPLSFLSEQSMASGSVVSNYRLSVAGISRWNGFVRNYAKRPSKAVSESEDFDDDEENEDFDDDDEMDELNEEFDEDYDEDFDDEDFEESEDEEFHELKEDDK